MNNYIPLRVHSDNSLLKSPSHIDQISQRAQELEFSHCVLTDCGNVAGIVQFISSCKKREIKPILGIEFNICHNAPNDKSKENEQFSTIILLAKNFNGYKQLLKIVSESNQPHHFCRQPRLDIDTLSKYLNGNIIGIDGYMGSSFSSFLLGEDNLNKGWIVTEPRNAIPLLNNVASADIGKYCGKMTEIFGHENYFFGVSLLDIKLPLSLALGDGIREISNQTKIPTVALPNSYYLKRENAIDQKVLLCVGLNTTMSEVEQRMIQGQHLSQLPFLKSTNYFLPSYQEMINAGHTEKELERTCQIGEMCEEYDVRHSPIMPNFTPPEKLSSSEYVRQICREGWLDKTEKIDKVIKEKKFTKRDYGDRFKEEFEVLDEANLFNYFLVIYDIMQFAKNKGVYTGAGRGSVGGSLIAYLMGLTEVDPLEYNLLFSRFFNKGRKESFPDIDSDVEMSGRVSIIEHLRNKYGKDNVAQICTFGRMQGRACLKDVLRVWSSCSFSEMNTITQYIPDESKISDHLATMKKERGESSILQWALENNSEQLKEWAYLDDENNIQGPLARRFEQSRRLEGTKRSLGRHAAGIVISDQPLHENCPLIYSSSDNMRITGWEMNDVESVGLTKIDLLGLNLLDKLHTIVNLLEEN